MLFHSWLRTLRTVLTRPEAEGKRGRAHHRQPAARCRPRLEALEDRLAPANTPITITPSANPDPVAASLENANALENAIGVANITAGPDEIDLPPRDFLNLGVTNQYSFLQITDDLKIVGAGLADTFITGNGKEFLAFDIYNCNVTISDLTIMDSAGAVRNHAGNTNKLTIDKCTLTGNQADQGGAIYSFGGNMDVKNSTLSGNWASTGAAIYFDGPVLNVTNCVINNNNASFTAGGLYVDPAVVTIIASTFSGNTAPVGADLYNLDSSVLIIGSSIANIYSSGGTISDPIRDLLTQVAGLDLNSGQKSSLTSTLQAAQRSLTNVNATAGVNQLNAFVNQLNALVRSRRLGEITADSLVNDVDKLISAIV